MTEKNIKEDLSDLIDQVSKLEDRISTLEGSIGTVKHYEANAAVHDKTIEQNPNIEDDVDRDDSFLEANIGEYGLAWFGNIILLFGGIFLHLYIQSKGFPLYAALIGYAFAASMILFSKKIQKSYSYLSSVFGLFSKLLMFYVTVGLHFFTTQPFIENKFIALALLSVLIIYQVYLSINQKSEKQSQIALLFLIITAILSNETHILLPLLTVATAGSVNFLFRFGWSKTLIITLLLVYFSFLTWLLGNPFVNTAIKAVADNQFSEFYLFAIGALFSATFFLKRNELIPNETLLSVLILNVLGFSVLLAILTNLFFSDNYQLLFALISVYCILYSVLLKKYSPWKYSPALYAVYGFVAISITFYGILKFPMVFLALSLQSLLVLSMALWFRSKIIVVLNTLMFIGLTIVYFWLFEHVDIINFSFAIVAAVSARIIHWQQERLTLKSQSIRHFYLVILFFTLLYALKMALPSEYITLSWSIAALVYFGLSILLRLKKYRYLAIANLGAASLYLFFIDLATIVVIYRIVAFLVLAVISIGISVYYVEKYRYKSPKKEE